jgi:hypothetical protein
VKAKINKSKLVREKPREVLRKKWNFSSEQDFEGEGLRRRPEGGEWELKNSPRELGIYHKSQPKPLSSSAAKTA